MPVAQSDHKGAGEGGEATNKRPYADPAGVVTSSSSGGLVDLQNETRQGRLNFTLVVYSWVSGIPVDRLIFPPSPARGKGGGTVPPHVQRGYRDHHDTDVSAFILPLGLAIRSQACDGCLDAQLEVGRGARVERQAVRVGGGHFFLLIVIVIIIIIIIIIIILLLLLLTAQVDTDDS